MKIIWPAKALAPASLAVAALVLGACSSMTTYGTGKSAAKQTLDDIGGIVSLGGNKGDEAPIDYSERPAIVVPPETTSLPTPGSADTTALAGDWPNDPDEADKRTKEMALAAAESGQSLKFSLPETAKPKLVDNKESHSKQIRDEKAHASLSADDQKKLFAEAKAASAGSVDANGIPIRRYLTEPPADYRAPDPESPVVITEKPEKKGKFRWPDLWPF